MTKGVIMDMAISDAESARAAVENTLASESRLCRELVTVLRRQRSAIAQDDLPQVEETVYSTHRVLHTLGEAQRRRRTLFQLMDAQVEAYVRKQLAEAIAQLKQEAHVLVDEVETSQRVLRSAMDSADEQVRILYAAAPPPAFYGASTAPAAGSDRERALLKRKA